MDSRVWASPCGVCMLTLASMHFLRYGGFLPQSKINMHIRLIGKTIKMPYLCVNGLFTL